MIDLTDIPRRTDISQCPICHGARFASEEYCSKECRNIGEYSDLAKHGVPEMIARKLDTGRLSLGGESLRRARAAMTDKSPGVFIFGSVGSGKTFSAAALALELLANARQKATEARRRGDWRRAHVAAADNIWTTPEAYCRAEFGKQKEAAGWRKSPLLILDDLGREINSEAMLGAVTALVDERIMWGRKTAITSNLSLEQIGTVGIGGDRLASRLASLTVIRMDGEDRRLSRD